MPQNTFKMKGARMRVDYSKKAAESDKEKEEKKKKEKEKKEKEKRKRRKRVQGMFISATMVITVSLIHAIYNFYKYFNNDFSYNE